MYDGGTKINDVKAALNAEWTLSLQYYNTRKTLDYCRDVGQAATSFHYPLGVEATDELLMVISEISSREIPEAIRLERGRLIDAMADSQAWLYGKNTRSTAIQISFMRWRASSWRPAASQPTASPQMAPQLGRTR